jgi:hypothetical protein
MSTTDTTDAIDTSSPATGAAAAPSPALVRALRQVLRPLVRLMLSRGITYPYLADLLKGLFVEVADKDFRLSDKPPTDSRVSLVSGVHRKDVSRLRAVLHTADDAAPSVVSLGAQLVAHWLGAAQYLDEAGQPKPLARFASEGGAMSFEALVASVNSDIRSRVVLDEWLRLGVVHLDEQRRVCLNADAFVPAKGFDEKAFYFGHNLHDHAAAAVHNLGGAGQPFMERSVHYDALSPESITRIAAQSQKLGMQTLLAINKSAMAAEAQDATAQSGAPRQRMTFGVYFYAEPAADPAPAATTGDTP